MLLGETFWHFGKLGNIQLIAILWLIVQNHSNTYRSSIERGWGPKSSLQNPTLCIALCIIMFLSRRPTKHLGYPPGRRSGPSVHPSAMWIWYWKSIVRPTAGCNTCNVNPLEKRPQWIDQIMPWGKWWSTMRFLGCFSDLERSMLPRCYHPTLQDPGARWIDFHSNCQ